ncbi:delta-class carbonic anhydrase [Microbulbifer sp. MLAF003]|uniref:delta-class carbonic anhydrase n=1 Tax=unclassified Microbulbifer TaxID=2619833 RepID=UPI0024AE0762|nr:delta-class carbonic anhydrase [Microbulbifer sp. MLAF003]WHI51798.1 delta-class carbonic anhydrase [Microbulbifer sp. MLAF003]
MKLKILLPILISSFLPLQTFAVTDHSHNLTSISDEDVAHQRANLAKNTQGRGFGPQSPRDIDLIEGRNTISFSLAPAYSSMNLCNIHFHKNAEHKGGEFTIFAGNGNGLGYDTGFKFSGSLSAAELAAINQDICPSEHGGLRPGDTIEVHYVHSSAKTIPGPSLGACLNDSVRNPQLRVEAQVYVLVNDHNALDFRELTKLGEHKGFHQAVNIPANTGLPIQYPGSTTGPGYNEQGSPFQVTWSVRPRVAKVNIKSVDNWCRENVFNEDHAHGVRNLITNPDLLSGVNP